MTEVGLKDCSFIEEFIVNSDIIDIAIEVTLCGVAGSYFTRFAADDNIEDVEVTIAPASQDWYLADPASWGLRSFGRQYPGLCRSY